MIRFRIGQSWKRERSGRPQDAFGLELDGVDLLKGASEEPLDRVVVELCDALLSLCEGKSFAEVALPEAHLELVLRRDGYEAELQVISLARPARRLRGPLHLDLEDLVAAAVKAAQALLQDVREASPQLHPQLRRALSKKVQALEGGPSRMRAPPPRAPGFSHRHKPQGEVGFGFEVEDPSDLLGSYDADQPGALGPLLCAGALSLTVGAQTVWTARGVPFLMTLELARQAAELVHALELGEPFRFAPGGVEPVVDVDVKKKLLRIRRQDTRAEPEALARAMFELGQQLSLALTTHHRPLAKNPWVAELLERCQEGLSQLGTAIRPVEDERPARAAKARPAKQKPLQTAGRLRRLLFDRRWEKQIAEDEERGRLLLGRRGPIYLSPHVTSGFTAKGDLLFRHVGAHGVAACEDGWVLTASANQVRAFLGGADARWLRDHDGMSLGPELWHRDGVLVTASHGRGAAGFSEVTGRELWRLVPPRTQRAHLSVQAHRALLGTDTGFLYGLDLSDGQVRFRMRSAMPFTGPTVPWGRRLLATIGRGGESVLFAADAHSGNVVWAQELSLGQLSRPLLLRNRIFVAGDADGEGVLMCLSARGKLLWERRLHLGGAPLSLMPVGRSVVAASQSGAAMMFSSDGLPEWRLGAAGEELALPVAPRMARGVLVIPGEVTRAVDPRGGRVLGELRTGIGLVDLAVDSRLNVFALDEDGTLAAYRLVTALSVV